MILRPASPSYLISGYSGLYSETLSQISKQVKPFFKEKRILQIKQAFVRECEGGWVSDLQSWEEYQKCSRLG